MYEDLYMDDQFEEWFNDNVGDIVADNPDLFNKEQLKYISEEYGIEEDED